MSSRPPVTPSGAAGTKSGLDADSWVRSTDVQRRTARWMGWRLRALVLIALVGCLGLFLLMRLLAGQPALDATFTVDDRGALRLVSGGTSVVVAGMHDERGGTVALDTLLMQRTARWLSIDTQRLRLAEQQTALAQAVARGEATFVRADGSTFTVKARPRGVSGLGWAFWPCSAAALLLYLVAVVVVFTRPDVRNVLYATLALSQVGQLLLLAIASQPLPTLAPGWMAWDLGLRTGLDLATGAALVHVTALYPRRVGWPWLHATAAWGLAAGVAWAVIAARVPASWWWTQGAMMLAGIAAVSQLALGHRRQAHPLSLQLMRFCATALGALVLLTAMVPVLDQRLDAEANAGALGGAVWVLFLSAMLLLLPFLERTHALMREFSLVAGVSTVATALDLLFVTAFSLGSFASLTLALFISLAVYATVRQWLMARLVSRERLTTERMFEHLYRMAREVQARPRETAAQLGALLRELFDPLHQQVVARRTRQARVVGDGASLVVPMPELPGATRGALVLDFAERGRRLFTMEDARLADRVVDLIARAVAFDQAVERGRIEERVRIAQDLHDDIGARLLTLMYQAPTPEMEDYLRHTLKDLKTLTRGLAAPSHLLSHAVAEWKADIAQRLAVADCELGWTFAYESDFELTMVQWSALTRVLRELVSNAIAHARASRVEIDATIDRGTLTLVVADNGGGSEPSTWAHGLGLGGVRKRVKQLAGDVSWQRRLPSGVVCRVVVPAFAPPASPA